MNKLTLFSEPFAPTGNISAEGFRNLLGRPTLGLTKTVIREAFQNSLDAARNGSPPQILLRVRTLTGDERDILASRVFAELPAEAGSSSSLRRSLEKAHLRVMEIADFGTSGLGGPTRADLVSDDPDQRDFVNFMRNVGAARDVHQGGGTYGYGKTSLYAMSSCAAIVADSETSVSGRPVRRLMACHLGAAHDGTGVGLRRRYTGRHWWGVADGDAGVDPAEEELAGDLSSLLGMPERTRGRTGTTILIVDPLLRGEDSGSVADDLVETVLWNFWPRMTETTPAGRRLDFRLEVDGQAVHVPKPEEFPPLDLFAAALRDIRDGAEDVHVIRSQRPAKDLGKLAVQRGVRGARSGGALRESSAVPEQCSHIALMRPVELVVKYVTGEAFPDRRYEWAGVFVCSDEDEVEHAFAKSEPPAHDDWAPHMLPRGPEKTYVNVALREIENFARTHALPAASGAAPSEHGPSLAATATRMGRILDRATRSGPGRDSRSLSVSKKKTLGVTQPRFVRLETDGAGRPFAVFSATLTNDGSADDLIVVATPHLVMDGGSTSTDDLPPDFSASVNSIRMGSRSLHSDGPALQVGTSGGELEITVAMPAGAAVGLRLALQNADA